MSFACPTCKNEKTHVYDSRPNQAGNVINRRRRCKCGHKFTTYELTSEAYAALAQMRDTAAALIEQQRTVQSFIADLPEVPERLGANPR